jgi:type I restriction enzyme R subunit
MIGRGTRLCHNVFAPGVHKDHFLIFDVCGNFAFFEVEQGGKPDAVSLPLAARLFNLRLRLSQQLLASGTPEHVAFAQNLLDELHTQVTQLNLERFEVRMQREWIDKFEARERWNNLNQDDLHELTHHLAGLIPPEKTDEAARRFDLLMRQWQLANLQEEKQMGYQGKMLGIVGELSKKYGVPEVAAKRGVIEAMKDPQYYQTLEVTGLERIRQDIKYLVRFLDKQSKGVVYTNFKDSEASVEDKEYSMNSAINLEVYKARVAKYIRENKHNITIAKLLRNEPINASEIQALENILFDGDERGTRAEYAKAYGEQPLGELVRSIVGLERSAAQAAFAKFLEAGKLNPNQIKFVEQVVDYLCQNGILDEKKLFEPPFTHLHDQGLLGVFKQDEAEQIIGVLRQVRGNASGG